VVKIADVVLSSAVSGPAPLSSHARKQSLPFCSQEPADQCVPGSSELMSLRALSRSRLEAQHHGAGTAAPDASLFGKFLLKAAGPVEACLLLICTCTWLIYCVQLAVCIIEQILWQPL
jgi:hypothetical protein